MITDGLIPNLMFGNGVDISTGQPHSGDGSQLVEIPYTYVYDGTGLTDATSPYDRIVPVEPSSDFTLRRIFGLADVASRIHMRKANQQWASDLPWHMDNNHAVVPEENYPASSYIQFDLVTVLRSFLACGGNPIYDSFLYFQGVKRFLTAKKPYETPYNYKALPFVYQYSLALNWAYYTVAPLVAAPRQQFVDIKNYDFELHEIRVNLSDNTVDATSRFRVQLYDYSGSKISNLPITINYINDARVNPCGVFPVPPLLFPANSQLQFDVTSLKCTADTPATTYKIQFVGKQRYPLQKEG